MDTTDKMKSLIIDLYQAGQSLTQIAKKTGVQYSLVYCYIAGNDNITDLRKSPHREKLAQPSVAPQVRGKSKPSAKRPGSHGCNPDCVEWRRCRASRCWVDGPLPCEVMLDWETENEFERDSSPSYWVIPLEVRVNIEVMG